MEVLDTVYAALTGSANLMAMVRAFYHHHAPGGSAARYPYIVYTQTADAPNLVVDNTEIKRRVTVRIHIVTKDGAYRDIYADVQRIMLNLGFMRVSTNDLFEFDIFDEFIRVVDYRIGVDS